MKKNILIIFLLFLTVNFTFPYQYKQDTINITGDIVKIKGSNIKDSELSKYIFMLRTADMVIFQEYNPETSELKEIYSTRENCIDFEIFNDFLILLKKSSIEYVPLDGSKPKKLRDIATVFPIRLGINYRNNFIFKFDDDNYAISIPEDDGYRVYFGMGDKPITSKGVFLPGEVKTEFSVSYNSIPPSEKLSYEFKYLHIFSKGDDRYFTVFVGNSILLYKIINNEDLSLEFKIKIAPYKNFRYSFRDIDLNGHRDLMIFSDIYTSTKVEIYFDGDISTPPLISRIKENAVDIHGGRLDKGKLSDLLVIYYIQPIALKQYVKKDKVLDVYFVPRIQWEKGRYKRMPTKAYKFIQVDGKSDLFYTLNNFFLSDITGDKIEDVIYYYKGKLSVHINDEKLGIGGLPIFTIDVGDIKRISYVYNADKIKNDILVFKSGKLMILKFF
ncbi:hypothetical protein KAU33_08220 [Candidatus Dependentiae bacterium]|nr:hypothetical protein [Candidatus Dependentiae bacterium]